MRKFALHWFKARGFGASGILVWSSLLFALMHWGGGLTQIVSALCFGAAAMALYMRHQQLWPLIAAHYLANLLMFSGGGAVAAQFLGLNGDS